MPLTSGIRTQRSPSPLFDISSRAHPAKSVPRHSHAYSAVRLTEVLDVKSRVMHGWFPTINFISIHTSTSRHFRCHVPDSF
ncbi:hypothetical protein FRC03_002314 [Tulasnella sp. 419]|nr:hypothetical protein FRC03_002314 [Tulasnella sp. 419]